MDDLSPEDAKLLTLARGAKARVSAPSGAAVRDETGRTYASAAVDLPSVQLSGLLLAVAQAAASGARGLEAAVVVGAEPDESDLDAVRDLGGADIPVHLHAGDGSFTRTVRS